MSHETWQSENHLVKYLSKDPTLSKSLLAKHHKSDKQNILFHYKSVSYYTINHEVIRIHQNFRNSKALILIKVPS